MTSVTEKIPFPQAIIKVSENEAETCKQMEPRAVNGNPEEASRENCRTGPCKIGFDLSFMRGKEYKRKVSHALKKQKDLQFQQLVAQTVTNPQLQTHRAQSRET